MANDVYFILRTTLKEIADAIRRVKGVEGAIPVGELDTALLSGVVSTSAPMATESVGQCRGHRFHP